MKHIWNWFKKDSSTNSYERILSQLALEINHHESRLSTFRLRSVRVKRLFTLYCTILYLIYFLIWILFYMRNTEDIEKWFLRLSILIISLFCIYFGRVIFTIYYTKMISSEESSLELLRTKQYEKVEELKAKTNFYSTQLLIDRYSGSQRNTPEKPAVSLLDLNDSGKKTPKHSFSSSSVDFLQPTFQHSNQQNQTSNLRLRHTNNSNTDNSIHESFFTTSDTPFPTDSYVKLSQDNSFISRILNFIIGPDETSPENRYALICKKCGTHNGLAPYGEKWESIKYICMNCGIWNGNIKQNAKDTKNTEDPLSISNSIPNPNETVENQEEIGLKTSKPDKVKLLKQTIKTI
ncbi:hypothetical protein PNEG_02015 [Pneumocystis murina B123]|uniref:Endoplasmic reticulum junction formation protein lunapark n=1 Tax=Pneumocystis murina (strain B123) TaxID=1069680 RepID=M7PHB1_PNEMU|nr:hypothetical protein PNEG_02015 [Pneumocystis murina B123]EMR09834.1 hypothetical protein PNEG_02015 [Pneumocystis murina B123]